MSKTSPRFFAVEEEVVDPALSTQYEQGIKLLLEAMHEAKLGSEGNWSAGKHNQSYFYVFAVQSLNDLDPESALIQGRFQDLMEAIGEETKRFAALTIPAVRSARLFVLERLEDCGYRPANSVANVRKYAFVDVHRVRADMHDQYEALINRLIEAMRKAEYPFGWSAFRTIIGEGRTFYGRPRTYYYVAPFDRMSQFFEQHWFGAALNKALGTEGTQQYSADEMKCLQGLESFTCTLRADLSYQAHQIGS